MNNSQNRVREVSKALGALYAIAFVSGLTSAGCYQPPGHPTQGANAVVVERADNDVLDNDVRGWLDRVEGKPRIGSAVNVVGWAAAERPGCRIETIEILMDGIEIGEAVRGVERSDVANSYGKPDWNKSGWEAEVQLDKILPGEHKIEAVVLDSSQARHMLSGARSITVLDSR